MSGRPTNPLVIPRCAIAHLRAREARARNPSGRMTCGAMDSGLVLRTPRNDESVKNGQSAGRWLAGVDRQLSSESPLVGGPRFAAGDIGGEVWIFVQHARWFQPEQDRHHHQVTRAERTIEPVGAAKVSGELVEPVADPIPDQRQALPGPGLVALKNPGGYEFKDRRL